MRTRIFTPVLMALGLLQSVAFGASIQPGSGAAAITATSTGIYQINVLTNDAGERRETLALIRDGRLIDTHTRKSTSKAYLVRGANSTSIRKSTSLFNQLIAAAGGINRDVDAIGGAAKTNFYSLAGFAGTNSPPRPTEVAPISGNCPPGYEMVHVKMVSTCRLIAGIWDRFKSDALLVLENSGIIASAQAAYTEFSFRLMEVADLSHYTFLFSNDVGGAGVSGFRIQAFGFDIVWIDTPGG